MEGPDAEIAKTRIVSMYQVVTNFELSPLIDSTLSIDCQTLSNLMSQFLNILA